MSKISKVEVVEFAFELPHVGSWFNPHTGSPILSYEKGARRKFTRYLVAVESDDGIRGEYIPHFGASRSALAQTLDLAPLLLGRDPEEREKISLDFKILLRHFDQTGLGALDVALWDWAGQKYRTPIRRLIGGYRSEIPAYASTYHGQPSGGGLDRAESFADFARQCREMGFPGFKIHSWWDGDPRREAELLFKVKEAAGDAMAVMTDPGSTLATFSDALYVGRACDEVGCLWYEDPFQDASTSAFSHKRMRQFIKTPLLLAEHVRGREQKADFVLAGGTDILHIELDFDGGLTGALRLAHFAEALGMDVQVHTTGPAQRHFLAATRNTLMYELGLVGPDERPNLFQPPVYACGYSDDLTAVNERGAVPVPEGPGLGVVYDHGKIKAWETARHVFKA